MEYDCLEATMPRPLPHVLLALAFVVIESVSGQFVYVPMRQGGLSVVNTVTNTVTTAVKVGTTPLGVAVNPPGTRVYVCNNGSNDVSVIDTSNNTVVATIPVSSSPK